MNVVIGAQETGFGSEVGRYKRLSTITWQRCVRGKEENAEDRFVRVKDSAEVAVALIFSLLYSTIFP